MFQETVAAYVLHMFVSGSRSGRDPPHTIAGSKSSAGRSSNGDLATQQTGTLFLSDRRPTCGGSWNAVRLLTVSRQTACRVPLPLGRRPQDA